MRIIQNNIKLSELRAIKEAKAETSPIDTEQLTEPTDPVVEVLVEEEVTGEEGSESEDVTEETTTEEESESVTEEAPKKKKKK